MEITIWFVGTDPKDAIQNMPFDSPESAGSFQYDNPGLKLYEATVTVNEDQLEEV